MTQNCTDFTSNQDEFRVDECDSHKESLLTYKNTRTRLPVELFKTKGRGGGLVGL